MRISIFIFLTTALFVSGCSSSYTQQLLVETPSKLERGKGVFISVPANGRYGNQVYTNSGMMTADAVRAAFLKYTNKLQVSDKCHADTCFSQISKDDYAYYVQPEILHWEDRATEWSGLPDRMEIKLTVFDISKKQELSSVALTGKSKWATFGGDHPQDLLAKPIGQYVDSLFK